MSMYESLGHELRARRAELRINQSTLAEWAGVSRTTIANIEADKAVPTTRVREDLLTALDNAHLQPAVRLGPGTLLVNVRRADLKLILSLADEVIESRTWENSELRRVTGAEVRLRIALGEDGAS